MKIATILPTAFLPMIRETDYHMALAQEIDMDKKNAYTKFYKSIGQDEDKYLILDNGAAEGGCRPLEEILAKAMYLGADEIILPDVLYDTDATLQQAILGARAVQETNIVLKKKLKMMAVPQGETVDEWLWCAQQLLLLPIDVLGIPKLLTKLGGRDTRMHVIFELQHLLRGREIHLLGCWEDPLEVCTIQACVKQGDIPEVRGVDSAIAYVHTKAGIALDEDIRPDVKFKFNEETSDIDMQLLRKNVDIWTSFGKGGCSCAL